MANRKGQGSELSQLLEALKMYRAAEGEEAMWALVPRGVEFLARLLEEIEGIGEEYALEVALKTALEVGGEWKSLMHWTRHWMR